MYPTPTVIVAKNGPSPARTYSFIDPAFGIMVASSEKLMLAKIIVMNPIASAISQTQLAKKPPATVASTLDATIRLNVVPIAVGRPTTRRSRVTSGACAAMSPPVSVSIGRSFATLAPPGFAAGCATGILVFRMQIASMRLRTGGFQATGCGRE
jgi:hypothetical protein